MQGRVNLNPEQVADRLCCSKRTLQRMRTGGEGPPWFKHGAKVLYPLAELEAYERASLSHSYLVGQSDK